MCYWKAGKTQSQLETLGRSKLLREHYNFFHETPQQQLASIASFHHPSTTKNNKHFYNGSNNRFLTRDLSLIRKQMKK